jgi:hypothetical protein
MRRIAAAVVLIITTATLATTAHAGKSLPPPATIDARAAFDIDSSVCTITADAFWTGYRPDYVIIGIRNGTGDDLNQRVTNRVEYTSKTPNYEFRRTVPTASDWTAYVQIFKKAHAGDVLLDSAADSTIDTTDCFA